MRIISARLHDVLPVNCGEQKTPVYRVFFLFPDSFIVSKHTIELTNKELFGGSFVTGKKVELGAEKFFSQLLGPVLDPATGQETIRTFLESGDEEEKTILHLVEEKFDRVMLYDIKSLKLSGSIFSDFRKIEIHFAQGGFARTLSLAVCSFTPWGVKPLPEESRRIYKLLQSKAPSAGKA